MKTLTVNFKFNEALELKLIKQMLDDHFDGGLYSMPFEQIRDWAEAKGIYAKGDPKTQTLKLGEEFGELSKAILNNNMPEIIDAIGDCVVVLVSIAKLNGLDIEDCIESAYSVIADRKGKMENGTFIKE